MADQTPQRSSTTNSHTALSRLRATFHKHITLTWLYPIKGFVYFLRHRHLWPLLSARLLPLTILSLGITTLLFLTLYLPQVAVLAIFHRNGSAWVNGTFLVLEEATLIIAVFFEAFLVDHTQVDIFDSVVVGRGHADLVKTLRAVDDDSANPVQALGPREKGAEFAPFSFRQIAEFVLLLPLNFIPYAGVPLFLLLTGYRAGPLLMWRYFKLKGMDKRARKAFVKQKGRSWEFMWFGTAHLILQLIPVASLLFLLTSAVGSALWATDMEDRERRQRSNADANDEQPPPYTDEP
ncbi:hypothetical protein MBLNU457_7543t1 [Dothideomycetes sp. NU457]